jgi:predicted nucleotidyltransferase component of viral defense system
MLQANVVQPGTLDILRKIMQNPIFDSFVLVGGTSLALQIGHRLSIDLDFFSTQSTDHEKIKAELEEMGMLSENYRNKIMLRVELENIKMDFVTYKFDFLNPPLVIDGIRLASIEDICGMKLEAIKNRGLKKDFYDLYFLLKKVSLDAMLLSHSKKYPGTNRFQLLMSLNFFNDADVSETPVLMKEKNITWEQIKEVIRKAVKSVT